MFRSDLRDQGKEQETHPEEVRGEERFKGPGVVRGNFFVLD